MWLTPSESVQPPVGAIRVSPAGQAAAAGRATCAGHEDAPGSAAADAPPAPATNPPTARPMAASAVRTDGFLLPTPEMRMTHYPLAGRFNRTRRTGMRNPVAVANTSGRHRFTWHQLADVREIL